MAESGLNAERSSTISVVTWNLQGSAGVDIDGVAAVIAAVRPDVVVLQEIQRRQARRVAKVLDMPGVRWSFKSLAPSTWPEGEAILTPHQIVSDDSFVLQRSWLWNWRRRIGQIAEIERDGTRFGVLNVHLSPHEAGERRRREAHLVVERARRSAHLPIIAGDFNDEPGGPGYAVVTGAGWSDAWLIDKHAGVDGSTNWTEGDRIGRRPTQRLDFVFVPAGWAVVDAEVLVGTAPRVRNPPFESFDWFAERSDHLPLLAILTPPSEV